MPEAAIDEERDIRARKYKVGVAESDSIKERNLRPTRLPPRFWQVAYLSKVSQRLGRFSDNCDELFRPEPIQC